MGRLMINIQKLSYMEHTMCTEDNSTNPPRRIELNSHHYNELLPQLEGKFSKSMPTFWNTPIHEQWEDSCDVKVVRMNSTEEYNEQTINNTKWAGKYENIPVKKIIPDNINELIKNKNKEYNIRLLYEIDRLTYKFATGK